MSLLSGIGRNFAPDHAAQFDAAAIAIGRQDQPLPVTQALPMSARLAVTLAWLRLAWPPLRAPTPMPPTNIPWLLRATTLSMASWPPLATNSPRCQSSNSSRHALLPAAVVVRWRCCPRHLELQAGPVPAPVPSGCAGRVADKGVLPLADWRAGRHPERPARFALPMSTVSVAFLLLWVQAPVSPDQPPLTASAGCSGAPRLQAAGRWRRHGRPADVDDNCQACRWCWSQD